MVRKKHPTVVPVETLITNNSGINTYKDNRYIEVSRSSMWFYCALVLAMTFISGYFFGKSGTSSKTVEASANAALQVQPVVQPQAQPQAQQPTQPKISQETIKDLFTKNVVKFGSVDSKLLMVEVADPSCPYCHVAGGVNDEIGAQIGPQFKLVSQGGSYVAPVPEMKKLVDQGKAAFVWIYTRGHGNGELATKALYCAYDQGKFWQAHDLLLSPKGYDLQNNLVKNDMTKSQQMVDFLASAVDKNKLKDCLVSEKYSTRLGEDASLAASLGVNGTPGFYLNTTNFAGAYSWTDMKPVADTVLQ